MTDITYMNNSDDNSDLYKLSVDELMKIDKIVRSRLYVDYGDEYEGYTKAQRALKLKYGKLFDKTKTEFRKMVSTAVSEGASDIHIASNNRPAYRLHGKINYWSDNLMTDEQVLIIIGLILEQHKFEDFIEDLDVDAAATIDYTATIKDKDKTTRTEERIARFRVNAFKQRYGCSLVMRIISDRTPELSELHLPDSINKILELKEGLVLVTGPTGSGKSTTIAAIINEFNKHKSLHIVTIEDPVEYIHTPKKCVINQREIGADSKDYSRALRAALREDPDIILMGEIRDVESMSIALTAAETGHLVFSTLHTEGASKSIDRLIDMFPANEQMQALGRLSTTLKSVVSQRLLPRTDKPGRIGAFEIMFVTSAIANLIRENKIAQIDQMIEISRNIGMITKQRSIEYLLNHAYINESVAREYTFDVGKVDDILMGNQSSGASRRFNSR